MRLLACLLFVPSLLAAQEFDFYCRGPYRTQVPGRDAAGVAGFADRRCTTEQQQLLDRLIEAAPDRVRTEIIGRTTRGR